MYYIAIRHTCLYIITHKYRTLTESQRLVQELLSGMSANETGMLSTNIIMFGSTRCTGHVHVYTSVCISISVHLWPNNLPEVTRELKRLQYIQLYYIQ